MTRNVLIVDDSATTRAVVKVYLSGNDIKFHEATDGTAGMAIARMIRPDAIVLDLKLPGMDGLTFCRTIRADLRLRDTPILLITGSKNQAVEYEALAAGATSFMHKPIDGTALAAEVMKYLEKKK
jgi:CheY-like chemotaxis protein